MSKSCVKEECRNNASGVELSFASTLVNEVQSCTDELSVRLMSVYTRDDGGQTVRLRLRMASSNNTSDVIDSSHHRMIVNKMRRRFPLISIDCSENVLDGHYEIDATLPSKDSAWKRSVQHVPQDWLWRTITWVQYTVLFYAVFFTMQLTNMDKHIWTKLKEYESYFHGLIDSIEDHFEKLEL